MQIKEGGDMFTNLLMIAAAVIIVFFVMSLAAKVKTSRYFSFERDAELKKEKPGKAEVELRYMYDQFDFFLQKSFPVDLMKWEAMFPVTARYVGEHTVRLFFTDGRVKTVVVDVKSIGADVSGYQFSLKEPKGAISRADGDEFDITKTVVTGTPSVSATTGPVQQAEEEKPDEISETLVDQAIKSLNDYLTLATAKAEPFSISKDMLPDVKEAVEEIAERLMMTGNYACANVNEDGGISLIPAV